MNAIIAVNEMPALAAEHFAHWLAALERMIERQARPQIRP